MMNIDELLEHVRLSFNASEIDGEMVQQVRQRIEELDIQEFNQCKYMEYMTIIHGLSNHPKLYQITRTSINMHKYAVKLKLISCRMIAGLINYYQHNYSSKYFTQEVLAESIESLVSSTRICLNESKQCVSQVLEYYKYIHNAFNFISPTLSQYIQFIHWLNVVQLYRFKPQTQTFNWKQFQLKLSFLYSFKQIQTKNYKIFVQSLIMEVILKNLKSGGLSLQHSKNFIKYLSGQNLADFDILTSIQSRSIVNIQNSSQFIQIYIQIRDHGIHSINIDLLQQFIKKQQNFKDNRIFQIAGLLLEPVVLDIWFRILNTKKQKFVGIEKAYYCFIHIVEESLNNNKNIKSIEQKQNIIKLANNVILNLLTQKRQKQKNTMLTRCIQTTIRTLNKILIQLVFQLGSQYRDLKQYAQKLQLVCLKYQVSQICRSIYTVLLYYFLMKRKECREIYQKFVGYNGKDGKSKEIYRILATVYQFRYGMVGRSQGNLENNTFQQQFNPQITQKIKAHIHLAILFTQKNEDLLILDLDLKQFINLNDKFSIYSHLIKKYSTDKTNIKKIIDHLENLIIKLKVQEIKLEIQLDQIQYLKLVLVEMVENVNSDKGKTKNSEIMQIQNNKTVIPNNQPPYQQSQIFFILINLYLLSDQTILKFVQNVSTGVLLNKYSNKIKLILNLIENIKKENILIDEEFYKKCVFYLFSICEKFKMQKLKKDKIGETGEIAFVHIIIELVQIINSMKQKKNNQFLQNQNVLAIQQSLQKGQQAYKPSQSNQSQTQFLNFVIFQINCLTNNLSKYLQNIDKISLLTLKSFNKSLHIPQKLKHKILRRMILQNLADNSNNQISLKQFKQIIEITQNTDQVELYIKFVFQFYGQQGRNMIMLLAQSNKRINDIILKQKQIQI